MRTFKITGRVVNRATQKGIKGLRVEVWDKDLLVNDMVGSAITGEGGVFRIKFDDSYFKEIFFDRRPDLFFKVFKGKKLVKNTKDSVLWNVDRENKEITIEVHDYTDSTQSETEISKHAISRSMLQATYTPRKHRAGEEPEAPRALEKAAFFAKLAPTPEELDNIACKYEKSFGNKKSKKDTSSAKILQGIRAISRIVSNQGNSSEPYDVNIFADMDIDVLLYIAQDVIQDRRHKLSSREIERLNVLLNVFRRNMSVEPVGYLHLERLSYTPAGIERGELIYSVPLSPGEEVNIKHREWSHITEEFERVVTDYMEEFSEEGVTEKTEIAQAVDSQQQHSSAFNTGVTASGSYGPISITTTVGYNASESSSKSIQLTRNQSADITHKASSRVKKEHKISFRVASAAETEDETVQRIKNPFSDRATRVDYYQLMRKWRIELFRYGIRLTWDMIIPEPGEGLLAKIIEIKKIKEEINKEFDLTKILGINKPAEISLDKDDPKFYLNLGEIYLPEAPPPLFDTIREFQSEVADDSTDCREGWYGGKNTKYFTYTLKIQDDYEVVHTNNRKIRLGIGVPWRVAGGNCKHYKYSLEINAGRVYEVIGGKNDYYKEHETAFDRMGYYTLWVSEEDKSVQEDHDESHTIALFIFGKPHVPGYGDFPEDEEKKREQEASLNALNGWTGELEVKIDCFNIHKFAFRLEIPIRLKPLVETQWKQKIWNAFEKYYRSIYEEKRHLLKERLSQLEEELGAQDALSLRKKEREEVMKGVLEAFGLSPEEERYRDPRVIRFIHHALEWENMLYFLYPYFWTDPYKATDTEAEQEHPYWEFKKYLDHPDPMHRAFLKAGAARVVLPVRPGFEEAFLAFVNGRDIEDLPPAPYLEIGKEFEAYARTNYPGILAATTVENYRPLLSRKQLQTWGRMQLMMRLLEVYRRVNGRYPSSEEGLTVLRDFFPFKDPWNNEYVYRYPGLHKNEDYDYDLLSFGKDGKESEDDIANWNPGYPKASPEEVQAYSDIELISLLLEEYRRSHGTYPGTDEGLSILRELIPLKDAWENNFYYKCPGKHLDYDLVSYGADGAPGGENEDADIANWSEASLIGQWYEYTPTSALDIAFDEEMPTR